MGKLQQKIQAARRRGVYVFKLPASVKRSRKAAALAASLVAGSVYAENNKTLPVKGWAVFVEGEWYPRMNLTKREAVNLAYAISISKKVEIKVTFNTSILMEVHN